MSFDPFPVRELLVAHSARVGLLASVRHHVTVEAGALGETLGALVALERLLARVGHDVPL